MKVIAHYIGLSTDNSEEPVDVEELLPTISGCLLVVKSSVTMITLLLLPTISGCLRFVVKKKTESAC